MTIILVGCGAVWGLVTAMTGGNWQAGGVVAFVVLCVAMNGLRATQSAEQGRRIYISQEDDNRSRWW